MIGILGDARTQPGMHTNKYILAVPSFRFTGIKNKLRVVGNLWVVHTSILVTRHVSTMKYITEKAIWDLNRIKAIT
jgi:hypothetical protein